jgi:hypothetical protein
LPPGDVGRIGLAISRSNPKVLAAIVEHGFQPAQTTGQGADQKPNPDYADMTKLGTGVYRSEDGGATWTFMSRQNNRPFYYSHIYINPLEDKWIYWLATSMSFSPDGGKTWSQVGGLHPDFHAMWIDPTNKNRFYVGQDGGASLTYDHGRTWVFYDNITVAQFYAVSADMRDPYYVYGGLQDNGTWGGPSMHREGQLLTDFWYNIGGGDGFHTQNDPQDWRIAYGESQGGAVQRINVETRESRQIRPITTNVLNYKEWYPPPPPDKKAPAKPAASRSQNTRPIPAPCGRCAARPLPPTGARRSFSPHNPRRSTSAATVFNSSTGPLDDHQPRPDGERNPKRPETGRGRVDRRHPDVPAPRPTARSSPSPIPVRPDLGRHRRRQRPAHSKRRRHLDQHHGPVL